MATLNHSFSEPLNVGNDDGDDDCELKVEDAVTAVGGSHNISMPEDDSSAVITTAVTPPSHHQHETVDGDDNNVDNTCFLCLELY